MSSLYVHDHSQSVVTGIPVEVISVLFGTAHKDFPPATLMTHLLHRQLLSAVLENEELTTSNTFLELVMKIIECNCASQRQFIDTTS